MIAGSGFGGITAAAADPGTDRRAEVASLVFSEADKSFSSTVLLSPLARRSAFKVLTSAFKSAMAWFVDYMAMR